MTIDHKANITRLLVNIAELGQCRGCHAQVYWVRHRNGKLVPYTAEGLNHFIDCPKAETFRPVKEPA